MFPSYHPLGQVFYHEGKDWCLRTLSPIAKGAFIMECVRVRVGVRLAFIMECARVRLRLRLRLRVSVSVRVRLSSP